MYTARPTYKVLIVGCDNAGKTTFLEQIKKMEGKKSIDLDKIPPTIGKNKFGKLYTLYNVAYFSSFMPNYV